MLNLDMFNKEEILSCPYSKRLLEKLHLINVDLPENSKIDIAEIEKGMIYAKYYHGDQRRDSGEPYYSHPFEVAFLVSDHVCKTDIIITAILHDTIEDTGLTKEDIAEVFGVKVAEQVYDLTRIKECGTKISSAQMIEDLYVQRKEALLVVKLCDRLHNMMTIGAKPKEKIHKIMWETVTNFLAAAAHLEQRSIEEAIYELCLKLYSIEHDQIIHADYTNLSKDYSH
jgi:(p)ppGpp synthase/HD superfamily hydrolase